MLQLFRIRPTVALGLALLSSATPLSAALSPVDRNTAETLLSYAHDIIERSYWPNTNVGKDFDARFADARKRLADVATNNDAYALIADTLSSVDPRIRFHPPARSVRPDYSWQWQVIGDAAYVTQIDRDGDAAKQGLKLGDRIVSFEGLPLDRSDYEQIYYAFNVLAPRPGLRVQVQSPGGEPRWLAIATTLRPARKTRTLMVGGQAEVRWVYTKHEEQLIEDFKDVRNHQRRLGRVVAWRAHELRRRISDVSDGLRALKDADALILDLRGQYVRRHETAMRLLDGLFTDSFDVGQVTKINSWNEKLRVHGSSSAFTGPVIVLVDSRTAAYAEVVARVLQKRGRARIIGDHTMGRVLEEDNFGLAEGAAFGLTVSRLQLPVGEITLTGEAPLDGVGVTPNQPLLPTPADLAARRDPVLTQAFAQFKETIAPEVAFKLFWIDHGDDEVEL